MLDILFSKETVVLRQWESETWKFGFTKRIEKRSNYHRERFGKLTFRALTLSSERTDQATCFVQLILWPQNYQQINIVPTVFSSSYQNKRETKKKKRKTAFRICAQYFFFDLDKNRMK